jgi:hypothetical protein
VNIFDRDKNAFLRSRGCKHFRLGWVWIHLNRLGEYEYIGTGEREYFEIGECEYIGTSKCEYKWTGESEYLGTGECEYLGTGVNI